MLFIQFALSGGMKGTDDLEHHEDVSAVVASGCLMHSLEVRGLWLCIPNFTARTSKLVCVGLGKGSMMR